MKYQIQNQGGAWVKKDEIVNGTKAKIVSETKPIQSNFIDKNGNPVTQDVAKIRIEGDNEVYNVNINRATLHGLISAFGEDSINWQNKPLTIETEKMRVSGKLVTALYLIPDGYKKIDDEEGYAVIMKEGENQNENPDDFNY